MNARLSRRFGAAALVLALAAALLRGWVVSRVGSAFLPPADVDEGYYERGIALLSWGCFSDGLRDAAPRAWRGPVFPAFAAASEIPFSTPSPLHLRLAQNALAVLAVLFAFWLGLRLVGPAGAVAGAALLALDPGQALDMQSMNVHGFYGLMLLATAGAAALWAQSPGRGRGVLLGLAFGGSLLTRSSHLFSFPAVLVLGSWVQGRPAETVRRAAWPVLGLALALAPWVARNGLLFHRVILLDSNSGAVNFYAASRGETVTSTVEQALALAEADAPGLTAAYARGDGRVYPELLALARARVLADPRGYLRSCWARARLLGAPVLPALLAAALAAFLYRRSRAVLAVAVVLFSLAEYALVAIHPDYVEASRPLLAVLAGWAIAWAALRLSGGDPARGTFPAPTIATAGAALFAACAAASLALTEGLIVREWLVSRRAPPGGTNALAPLDGRARSLTVLYARRARLSDADQAHRAAQALLDEGRPAAALGFVDKALLADRAALPAVRAEHAALRGRILRELAGGAGDRDPAFDALIGEAGRALQSESLSFAERVEAALARLTGRSPTRDRRGAARAILDRGLQGAAAASASARARALTARAALRTGAGADEDAAAAVALDADAACRRAPDLADPQTLPASYFAACAARFPTDARVLTDRGVALWRDHRAAEAAASLRAALRADPGWIPAALSLSAALGPAGAAESRRALRTALAKSSEPASSPLRALARAAAAEADR